jgi:hypothetical protein
LCEFLVGGSAAQLGAEVVAAAGEEAVWSLPSADGRARVQLPQNGCVTEAIRPISPALSR